MGLREGFLHDVRGTDFSLKSRPDLDTGQHLQIVS